MNNNDVLRSVRYALDLADQKIIDITKLSGIDLDKPTVINYLKNEEEPDFVECSDEVLNAFLDGLITHKRGKMDARPVPDKPVKLRLTNNIVLKKLRVAFELKEEDLHQILELAEFRVSKPELSALFRAKGHKNYRECGDQFLRNFLKGLAIRLRAA